MTRVLRASLAGQKKYAEAEPLVLEGYPGMLARREQMGAPDRYHLDRVRRIDGDRSEKGINLPNKKEVHRISAATIELRHRQNADTLAEQRRHELLVPTLVLAGHKRMQITGEAL